MHRYLSIVEHPYRATVEEQGDTALWFTHALHNAGAGVGVLLRGDAVVYGTKNQAPPTLRLGTRGAVTAPNIEADLRSLMMNHVTVYLVQDDAFARGIYREDFVPGLQHLPRGWLCKLYDSYERILHW